MVYVLNNKYAKMLLMYGSSSTYRRRRGHMFLEH